MFRIIFILPLIVLAVTGCGRKSGSDTGPVRVSVRTARPTEQTFRQTVATQGVVEPAEYAVISALVAGRLEELRMEESTPVKKGMLLFQSDRKNLENACRLAEEALKIAQERKNTRKADLELARCSLEKEKSDFLRNERLRKTDSVSIKTYEAVRLAYEKARLTISQCEAALSTAEAEVKLAETAQEIARKKLADSRVTAPFDGVVSAKFRRENEFCGVGTPVLKLERPGKKRICAMLSGLHYPAVKAGVTRIEVAFAGKTLCTVPVTIRGAEIDPASRTFEIKADLPREAALPSGTLCDIRVILAERKSAAVPEESLRFRQDGSFAVFAVRDGKAEEIEVKPGVTGNGWTELADPEALRGREIIVSGQYFVNPGTPVSVVKQ
ncbi:MAG: hypothetical protein IJS14_14365 [Lentisphaeria bacterium]|nr:hypothetical protein [Lentisphaeria bacterium]